VPHLLKSSFYDFQLEGYRWLQELWCKGAPGGILADDMGLGKTLQTLAFLAWLKEHRTGSHKPTLIVGPTGLLRNWRAEHDTHLHPPGLGHGLEAHGGQLARLRLDHAGQAGELASGLPSLDLEELKSADWVLTTYENLRDYQHSFAQVAWSVVVYDEAQRIKNPVAMTTQAAQAVDAEFSLAVTGTPVENELKDLWSIADTVQPGALGALKQFSDRFEKGGDEADQRLAELRRIILEDNPPPMMKRRLKNDHLRGLPRITSHVERVVMPPLQEEQYNRVLGEARSGGSMTEAKMLKALQGMRSVSLHPLSQPNVPDGQFIAASARLIHAIALLDKIRDAGEKALVFVEALDMQAALVEILQRRYRLPAPPPVINGAVAGHRRKDRVDEFQRRRGFDVMLLSPRAGGVGLTIVEANHVIHLSRWWNPAVEDQATDRVYRIGQERDVHVYLPLAIHPQFGERSFDALLHDLLERKRALSRGVLAPAIATSHDLRDLFEASLDTRMTA
jgi:SNF2 family DNA or RNA helicase